MQVIAIHAIHRGRNDNPSFVNPGQIVELTGKELSRVLDMGAAREATKTEIAISKLDLSDDDEDDGYAAAAAKAQDLADKKAAADAAKELKAQEAADKKAADAKAAVDKKTAAKAAAGSKGEDDDDLEIV